jgi:hypothetical protein
MQEWFAQSSPDRSQLTFEIGGGSFRLNSLFVTDGNIFATVMPMRPGRVSNTG